MILTSRSSWLLILSAIEYHTTDARKRQRRQRPALVGPFGEGGRAGLPRRDVHGRRCKLQSRNFVLCIFGDFSFDAVTSLQRCAPVISAFSAPPTSPRLAGKRASRVSRGAAKLLLGQDRRKSTHAKHASSCYVALPSLDESSSQSERG